MNNGELHYLKLITGDELISKVTYLEVEYEDGIKSEEIQLIDPLINKIFQDPETGRIMAGLFPWVEQTILNENKFNINPDTIVVMTNDLTDHIKGIYYTQLEAFKKSMKNQLINAIPGNTLLQEEPETNGTGMVDDILSYLDAVKDKKRILN